MDNEEQTNIAYRMQKSYRKTKNMYEAIELTKLVFPDANNNELAAMWKAIDAYVDMTEARHGIF